jgi:hypothetical protein
MNKTNDPVRWRDQQQDSALPEELMAAFASYAQQGPSSAQTERMAERLAMNIAIGGQASGWLSGRALRLVAVGVAVGLGVLVAAWPRSQNVIPTVSLQPHLPPAISTKSAPQEAHTPSPVVKSVPAPSTRPLVKARRAPVAAVHAPEASDPMAELKLLVPARQLIAAQPARALELAEEHARTFPHGVFVEERLVLTMEALARTGKRAQAEQAARAFTRRYPTSSYAERVELVLNAPTP